MIHGIYEDLSTRCGGEIEQEQETHMDFGWIWGLESANFKS